MQITVKTNSYIFCACLLTRKPLHNSQLCVYLGLHPELYILNKEYFSLLSVGVMMNFPLCCSPVPEPSFSSMAFTLPYFPFLEVFSACSKGFTTFNMYRLLYP